MPESRYLLFDIFKLLECEMFLVYFVYCLMYGAHRAFKVTGPGNIEVEGTGHEGIAA